VTPAKRIALRSTVLLAALGMASATYQQIAAARDRRRFPPPGRLIAAGRRRLHLFEAGEGTPTVVIIPALGSNVLEWLPTVQELEAETHICVYDRAGIGWSDSPRRGQWRTLDVMAAELEELLAAAGIQPPYILAGHSLGGIIARRFISRCPDSVCGLLLIDSSHEDQARRLREENCREGDVSNVMRALRRQSRVLGARRFAASLGLLWNLDADIAREAPPEFAAAARSIILSTRQRRTVVRELLILARPQGQPQHIGSMPLTVLTSANRSWSGWPAWTRMQAELVKLSSDSRHVLARRAGHYVHLDEPELVIQAIRNLVNRCR
jgi:pimeloyl-ACP methyl ester carboxylesterase